MVNLIKSNLSSYTTSSTSELNTRNDLSGVHWKTKPLD